MGILIYNGATFIIPSSPFGIMWLTDGRDMQQPTSTPLSLGPPGSVGKVHVENELVQSSVHTF